MRLYKTQYEWSIDRELTSIEHFELRARPNDQIHTKHVKTAGLEIIHLNTVYVLKWTRTVGRKLCINILS